MIPEKIVATSKGGLGSGSGGLFRLVSLKNIGKTSIALLAAFNAPRYDRYMRCESVQVTSPPLTAQQGQYWTRLVGSLTTPCQTDWPVLTEPTNRICLGTARLKNVSLAFFRVVLFASCAEIRMPPCRRPRCRCCLRERFTRRRQFRQYDPLRSTSH